MTERFRVGTRKSALARVQTDGVLARLERASPGSRFEVVPVDTSGDRDRSIGGSPDFTDTIDRALLHGEVDLAVHSAKDLPVELDRRFALLAVPPRANPRDCLVVGRGRDARSLPHGARAGSSSLRRRAQLLRWRRDLTVVEVRGNVDTRLRLVASGEVDAIVLAVAGITRLGRAAEIDRVLPTTSFLPAPAQGALAVVARSGDSDLASAVRRIDHRASRLCVTAERRFAAALGGDCRVPLGALATVRGGTISLTGEVLAPDGRLSLRRRRVGPARDAETLGAQLGRDLLARGASDLISSAGRR